MYINLKTRGMRATKALSNFTKEQLSRAVKSQEDKVLGASVWLSDINGPKGGVDQHCRVQLFLQGKKSVVISETSENMYAAIARAARRLSKAVNRRAKRRQTLRRVAKQHDVAVLEEAFAN